MAFAYGWEGDKKLNNNQSKLPLFDEPKDWERGWQGIPEFVMSNNSPLTDKIDFPPKELRVYLEHFLGEKKLPKIATMLELSKALADIWYQKGQVETPTASYDSKNYLMVETYLCYSQYSRGYVMASAKILKELGVKSILDFGAGCGATTKLLARLFPNATVYYQNISHLQTAFAEFIINEPNVKFVSKDLSEIDNVDAVYALEVFEHIKNPIEVLHDIMGKTPTCMVISNSFTAGCFGHYDYYYIGTLPALPVHQHNMAKMFNSVMKNYQFSIHHACKGFWNGRPKIWTR